MATPTLTVQIPDDLAEVLAPLDGKMELQPWDVRGLLRDRIRELGEELIDIAERAADPKAEDVRMIERQLADVSAGFEAVA